MTRDEMIRLLVLDRLEHSDDLRRYMRLQRLLEDGFRGFRNMSEGELAAEIGLLGLSAGTGEGEQDALGEAINDHFFDSSLIAGYGVGYDQSADN